jgi:hypothetical protein
MSTTCWDANGLGGRVVRDMVGFEGARVVSSSTQTQSPELLAVETAHSDASRLALVGALSLPRAITPHPATARGSAADASAPPDFWDRRPDPRRGSRTSTCRVAPARRRPVCRSHVVASRDRSESRSWACLKLSPWTRIRAPSQRGLVEVCGVWTVCGPPNESSAAREVKDFDDQDPDE